MSDEVKGLDQGAKVSGGGAAWAPVLGSVASSLLGGAAGIVLQREQRAYDKSMWDAQNKYNSPAAQVERLRAAGLNPGLNKNFSSGNNEQSPGAQSPPTMDFSPIAQGVTSSVELYLQRQKQNAEIDNINQNTINMSIRNKYENLRQVQELDKLIADTNTSKVMASYYQQEKERLLKENQYIDERNSTMIDLNRQQAAKAHFEAVYQDLLNDYQVILNDYAPEIQQETLNNLRLTGKDILASAAAHGSQAAYNAALKVLTDEQTKGVQIENKEKPRLARAIANQAVFKAREAKAYAKLVGMKSQHGEFWTKFMGSDEEENLQTRSNNIQRDPKQTGGVR